MADTAVNPKIVDMNTVELVQVQGGTMTGSIGIPIVLASGQAAQAADDEIPWGSLAEDLSSAVTTATDKIWVYRWKVGTRLEMYATTGGAYTTLAVANKGIAYDYDVIGTGVSAVGTLDKGAATDKIFRVIDLALEYDAQRYTTTSNPTKCIVEVMKVQTA